MNFDEVPWDWQATATLRWSAGKLQQIWHRKVSEISSLTNRPALRMETEWRDVPVEQAPSETNSDVLDIPDFLRNQDNLKAERATHQVPVGHFWRSDSNLFYCRHCGQHYDKHLHTDEASRCPTDQETRDEQLCPACDGVGGGITKDGIELECSRCNGRGGIPLNTGEGQS